jgi:nucleotide-binding universal stress UspA family protein
MRGAPLRIIVGVDGSKDSNAAVEEVARRSWPSETVVRIVTALDSVPASVTRITTLAFDADAYEMSTEEHQAMRSAAAAAMAQLHRSNIRVDCDVESGSAVELVLTNAQDWGADAIFVGAQGHSFMERVLLGSVSASIAMRAACAVEVVRRTEE